MGVLLTSMDHCCWSSNYTNFQLVYLLMEKITIELSSSINFLASNCIDCYVYDVLTSTNCRAWELYQEDLIIPFVVVAKKQTAGKGQRGNSWHSGEGGLYLTVALSPDMVFDDLSHVTLFAGVGITQELNKYHLPVKIKWLNDLILEGKKLGGILSEVRTLKGDRTKMIIGVGINWQNNLNLARAISIDNYYKTREYRTIYSYEELLNIIIQGIFAGYQIYYQQGINNLISQYNSHLIYQNQTVYYKTLKGLVVGVDNNANLVVKFSSQGSSSKVCFSPLEYAIALSEIGEYSRIFERQIII